MKKEMVKKILQAFFIFLGGGIAVISLIKIFDGLDYIYSKENLCNIVIFIIGLIISITSLSKFLEND